MDKKVYITASSIVCALGEDKKSSISKLHSISNLNYKEYLKNNFEEINYYRIKEKFNSKREKFFKVLEKL